MMSFFVTRPPVPVPGTVEGSMPCSAAMRATTGETNVFPFPVAAGATGAGAAAGSATGAAAGGGGAGAAAIGSGGAGTGSGAAGAGSTGAGAAPAGVMTARTVPTSTVSPSCTRI